MAIKINKKISRYNRTVYSKRNILYLVIHYVGAVSTAKNNADYFSRGDRQASAHYFVDDTSIWQSVENKNAAWHCGAYAPYNRNKGGATFWGKCTNANSIGIEMCCKKKAGKLYITDKTIARTAELVKYLMKKYDIPSSRVIRHFDVTGKECPAPYINSAKWAALKKTLTAKAVAAAKPVSTTSSKSLKAGDKVKITKVYTTSASSKGLTPAIKTGYIVKILSGRANPYLIATKKGSTDYIGWSRKAYIKKA